MREDILRHASTKLRELGVELQNSGKENLFDMESWVVDKPCGTVACFIGYAGLRGWFEPYGVTIRFEPRPHTINFNVPTFIDARRTETDYQQALKNLFGLELGQTVDCLVAPEAFDNDDKPGPADVAGRIDLLLELGESDFIEKMRSDGFIS